MSRRCPLRPLALALCLGVAAASHGARAQDDEGSLTLGSDTLLYTDTDNVRVLTTQLGAEQALPGEGSQVSARGLVDVISAASVDVVSHATSRFDEVRIEGDLALSYRLGEVLPSVAYRISHEPDYDSHGVTAGAELRVAGADAVLGAHYGITLDAVGRTDTPDSRFDASLTTHTIDVGLTQNLGQTSLLRGVYTLTLQRGYMEKPYRFVPLFTDASLQQAVVDGVPLGLDTFERYSSPERPPESVPDARTRHALGLRWLQYVAPLDGSIRLDYRFYVDDWAVIANTLEASLYQPIGSRLMLDTFARGNFQTAASFWERTYRIEEDGALPRLRTLDRKLSPHWSSTFGTRLELRLAPFGGYVELSATQTRYLDFLLLDGRVELIAQLGVEWRP